MSLSLSEVSFIFPKDHFLVGRTKPEGREKKHKTRINPQEKNTIHRSVNRQDMKKQVSIFVAMNVSDSLCVSMCMCVCVYACVCVCVCVRAGTKCQYTIYCPDSYDTIIESMATNADILIKIIQCCKQISCQFDSPKSLFYVSSQWRL